MSNKKSKKLICIFAILTVIAGTMSGCANQTQIPFSDCKWTWTVENVTKAEGKPKEVYDSVYGGDTYTYDKKFMKYDGTIKYMFDENGSLASVAWSYVDEDEDNVMQFYKYLQNAEKRKHGKSEFSNTNDTAYGDVWHLDDCTVIITTLTVNGNSGLQYAYINKGYSKS